MNISDLRDELNDEVSVILASSFKINVTNTTTVPHSGDPAITFPNLDSGEQGCKLIDTCVLYIDIRRSTELNLTHKPTTVAKLYSAFVRAMTRCARQYGGHVRGIIGDRVMVLFDCENAFFNAVETAILMNSTSKYVINKHFTRNEVNCGIGIDAGKMLATKTGFRRRGNEQNNYKNLVWLGRPANVASKLTDLANKPSETVEVPIVHSAYGNVPANWTWREGFESDFIGSLNVDYLAKALRHKDPAWQSFFTTKRTVTLRSAAPPILMTKVVYDGFKAAKPLDDSIVNGWFEKLKLPVPGYDGDVYGGDVIFKVFRD